MLSTALAANHGLRPALRFCMAVPAGWIVLTLVSGLGLGALLVNAPPLRLAVQLIGVAYLLWLAWRLSRSTGMAQADTTRMTIGFWSGVGLQFVNIKAWMLALTLSAGWIVTASGQPASNPGERLVIVCVLMALFAFVSNFSYALMGSLLRRILQQGQRLLWFNRAMALVLLLTAIWMLTV